MNTVAIERKLAELRALLPEGSSIALVIVPPPAEDGWQAGHVVDFAMDDDTREFATECLSNGRVIGPLLRQVN